MEKFYDIEPTLENYWRAIILFGRNSASYKFALAKALYDVQQKQHTLITLDQLAEPYAKYLCEHLKTHPKQATSNSSKFLDMLISFNRKDITEEEMIAQTVRYRFNKALWDFRGWQTVAKTTHYTHPASPYMAE